jgi:hypothetical protein
VEQGEEQVNPPAWWSPPWWSWFLTIIFAGVVAGLLVPALKNIVVSAWRHTLHRPFWLLVSNLKTGRHDCGHRSGSYATLSDGRRICGKCHQAEMARK